MRAVEVVAAWSVEVDTMRNTGCWSSDMRRFNMRLCIQYIFYVLSHRFTRYEISYGGRMQMER